MLQKHDNLKNWCFKTYRTIKGKADTKKKATKK